MSIVGKALMTAGAAVLCGIGSCAGFLSTLSINGGTGWRISFWNGFFGIAFGICVLTFIVGVLTAIIAAIVRAGRRPPETPPASQP